MAAVISPVLLQQTAARYREMLRPLWREIYEHPELGHQEHAACRRQTELLKAGGVPVETPFGGLATAFRAALGSGRPKVAFFSEYDALPELGHACGHPLIAVASLAAFLTVGDLLDVPGEIVLFGTPAEETFGGKIDLLKAGAFREIDCALACHPYHTTGIDQGNLAVARFDVEFFGKASHAASAPADGINALDALTLLFDGVGLWRQQLPAGARVHGIIISGGSAANIIPDYTKAFFYLRADSNALQERLKERFAAIVSGAGLMTGCRSKLTPVTNPYSANHPNPALNTALRQQAEQLGLHPATEIAERISTDFADVTEAVPGANLFFGITPPEMPAGLHTREFQQAAGQEPAFEAALQAAAGLAGVALRFFRDAAFRQAVRADFRTASAAN